MRLDERWIDTKHFDFGFVGISHKAAFKDIGRASDGSERACHEAARTGFCGRDHKLAAARLLQDFFGQSLKCRIHWI